MIGLFNLIFFIPILIVPLVPIIFVKVKLWKGIVERIDSDCEKLVLVLGILLCPVILTLGIYVNARLKTQQPNDRI